MLNYIDAQNKVKEGFKITRHGWGLCKIIRKAEDSDVEYINYPPENIIVEDCSERACDCVIAIFQPTPEDVNATDYVIAE